MATHNIFEVDCFLFVSHSLNVARSFNSSFTSFGFCCLFCLCSLQFLLRLLLLNFGVFFSSLSLSHSFYSSIFDFFFLFRYLIAAFLYLFCRYFNGIFDLNIKQNENFHVTKSVQMHSSTNKMID